MKSTEISILEFLSGDQTLALFKTLAVGAVVLLLAYGAFDSKYSLEISQGDITVKLNPNRFNNSTRT